MSVTIPKGSMFLRQHAEAVHAELVRLTGENVTSYRNDLEHHDLCCIIDSNAMPFIHVARETGTAYYGLPLEYISEPVPVGFGEQYQYEAMRNHLYALATCHDDKESIFYHYDGGMFHTASHKEAIDIYVDTIHQLDARYLLSLSYFFERKDFIRKCSAANENWNVSDYLVPTP